MIEKVHIPFGCALETRSDVCRVGLEKSPRNMMLRGNLFAEPMKDNLRDMPQLDIQPERWVRVIKDADSVKRNNIVEQNAQLIQDNTLAEKVESIATQLRTSYTFQKDFLDCMKMK